MKISQYTVHVYMHVKSCVICEEPSDCAKDTIKTILWDTMHMCMCM